MKRNLIAAVMLTTAMIGGGAGAVMAGHGPGDGFGGPPPGAEMAPENLTKRMAALLRLSDAQQSQIKTVLDAERAQVKPLLEKMRENRMQLRLAGEATTFDEAAVRTIAVAQAQIETELTVSRISTRSKINSILTAEQRELEKSLRPEPERRPPPPPGAGSDD